MYFWLINFFLFFSIIISGNKLFLLIFAVAGLFLLFFTGQKFISVIFSLLLFSLPFERGIRGWFFDVVSPGPESWMPGYNFYFGLSVKTVLFILLLLLTIFKINHKSTPDKWRLYDFLLIIFFGLSIISTFLGSDLVLSVSGLVSLTLVIGIYFIGTHLIRNHQVNIDIPQLGLVWLFWFGLVGTIQFVMRHPIGLFLEETSLTSPNGFYTTDGDLLYRVSGLTGHPTFFGSMISLLIPIGIGLLIEKVQKKQNHGLYFIYLILAIIFGVISVFATYSRSSWITLLFVIGLFGYKALAENNHRLKSLISTGILTMTLIIFLFFGWTLFTRLFTLTDISNLGNATGRLNLVRHAVQITSDYPVFGTGLNQFTQQLITHNLTIDERAFFYPVHNTFLLFFAELGIPAGICFGLFVAIILICTFWESYKSGWLGWGVWIGAFTFVINAQFHTLFNLDPTFGIFMLLCIYLACQAYAENNDRCCHLPKAG